MILQILIANFPDLCALAKYKLPLTTFLLLASLLSLTFTTTRDLEATPNETEGNIGTTI